MDVEHMEPAEAMQPEMLLDASEPAPKRTRKRRPKMPADLDGMTQDAAFTVEKTPEPRKPRASRAKKLNGKHVAAGIEKLSQLGAIMTGWNGWYVPPAEVEPWAGEAAEILNSIPSKYVDSALKLSGFVTVGFGVYMTVAPRMAMYAAHKASERAPAPAPDPAHGEGVNGAVTDFLSTFGD